MKELYIQSLHEDSVFYTDFTDNSKKEIKVNAYNQRFIVFGETEEPADSIVRYGLLLTVPLSTEEIEPRSFKLFHNLYASPVYIFDRDNPQALTSVYRGSFMNLEIEVEAMLKMLQSHITLGKHLYETDLEDNIDTDRFYNDYEMLFSNFTIEKRYLAMVQDLSSLMKQRGKLKAKEIADQLLKDHKKAFKASHIKAAAPNEVTELTENERGHIGVWLEHIAVLNGQEIAINDYLDRRDFDGLKNYMDELERIAEC